VPPAPAEPEADADLDPGAEAVVASSDAAPPTAEPSADPATEAPDEGLLPGGPDPDLA
jgi:hypothetical protein